MQALVVIDVSYSWNEKWVEYSEDLNALNDGKPWLFGLLFVSFLCFGVSGIYYILYTIYYTLYTIHYTLYIIHYIL